MSKSAQVWRPTSIRRFVQAFPTSACTALVETDAGAGYLKAMGGPEGPHTLVAEWVATNLARWFGLPTFDWAILPVTGADEIPFHDGGYARVGPAFITRREAVEPWGGGAWQLKQLSNPEDISRLVVFDTWVLNCDRHSWREERGFPKARVKRDNVYLSGESPAGTLRLKAMDHTHCFTCGREITTAVGNIDRIKASGVYGLFPEFRPHLRHVKGRQSSRS